MDPRSPKVAYLGLPVGARVLQSAGLNLVSIGVGPKDAPGIASFERKGAMVTPNLTKPVVQQQFLSSGPEVLLSFFWTKLIPPSVLTFFGTQAFNVHPSLLPAFRGPDPYFWAIRMGVPESGVTLHQLVEALDAGPIVAQTRVPMIPGANAKVLSHQLDPIALRMLVACASGALQHLPRRDQPALDQEAIGYAPSPMDEDLVIRWTDTAETIECLVRAASPFPLATSDFGTVTCGIAELEKTHHSQVINLKPGDARKVEGGLLIQTGTQPVFVRRVLRLDTEEWIEGTALHHLV